MAPTQQFIPVDEPVDRLPEPETRSRRIGPGRILSKLAPRRISAIYLLAFFVVLFGMLSPDTFLTEVTFTLVFRSGVVTCILALAFLVPLTAGVYDLSIGAVMALGLGIVVYLSLHTDLPDPGDGIDRDRGVRAQRGGVRIHRRQAARRLVHRDPRRQPGAGRRACC